MGRLKLRTFDLKFFFCLQFFFVIKNLIRFKSFKRWIKGETKGHLFWNFTTVHTHLLRDLPFHANKFVKLLL